MLAISFALSSAAVVFAQVSSEFKSATLVFKLTVSNPSSAPKHVVKVGVASDAHGTFRCLVGGRPQIYAADYLVRFHVTQRETLIDADPPLPLPPKATATFTISLYPNDSGACGYWYTDVNAIVLFDDGTRLTTPAERIDSDQVAAVAYKKPEREEVLAELRHRDPRLRLQALGQIAKVGLDPITAETVLRAKYSDPNRRVRSAAYTQSAEMKLTRLAPDLIARFDQVPGTVESVEEQNAYSNELLSLCDATADIHATDAIDKVLEVLTNRAFVFPILLQKDLDKLRSPQMPRKLIAVLEKYRDWAAAEQEPGPARGPQVTTRYDVLLEALVSYRNLESVPLLKSIMSDAKSKRTARSILRYLVELTDANLITQDPFVLAFHEVALAFVNDPWGDDRQNLREDALILAVRTSNRPDESEALLRAGLRDPSVYVRRSGAKEAAALKLTSLAPEVRRAYQSAPEEFREDFCKVIQTMGATCN